jgi:hypothetical protein
MAKRFTDTNKYKKPFYRALPGPYKLLWDFLYHDCDHAGIWIVDFETAQIYVGKDMPVEIARALELFNEKETRVVEIDGGAKWFIPGFIDFQYGKLKENNRAHLSVITILSRAGLLDADNNPIQNKPLVSPFEGAKYKDMDKDKELDKDITGNGEVLTPVFPLSNPVIDPGARVLLVPELWAIWSAAKPNYIKTDECYPSLRRIAEMIAQGKGMADYTDIPAVDTIKASFVVMVEFIKTDALYKDFQLTQIAKYFNAISSKIISAMTGDTGKTPAHLVKKSIIQNNITASQDASAILKNKYGPGNDNQQ